MDGLLMSRLASNLVIVAAIAVGALFVREAAVADPLVPHDQSVYDTKTLVSMACSKCHGANGVSISPLFPILAAQQAATSSWNYNYLDCAVAAIPMREPSCGG